VEKLKPPHTRSLAGACVLIIASTAAQGSPHASGLHATTDSKKGLICIDYCMDSCRPSPPRHHGQRDFRPLPKSGVGATVHCHGPSTCPVRRLTLARVRPHVPAPNIGSSTVPHGPSGLMCPDQARQTMPSATPSGACCYRRAWPDVQGIGVGSTVQAQQVGCPLLQGEWSLAYSGARCHWPVPLYSSNRLALFTGVPKKRTRDSSYTVHSTHTQ
jgi:hypothetical protein